MVDIELFGGYLGYLSHLRALATNAFGAYRGLTYIEWPAVSRLVFICKGNICRSPYASAKAKSLGVQSASFGIEASAGAPAHPSAVRNALARGIDLADHRSSAMDCSRITSGDLLIAFEPWQQLACRERCGDRSSGVTLLGIWTRPFRPHIQDPYGRSDRYFQECFAVIDAQVSALVRCVTNVSAARLAESSLETLK